LYRSFGTTAKNSAHLHRLFTGFSPLLVLDSVNQIAKIQNQASDAGACRGLPPFTHGAAFRGTAPFKEEFAQLWFASFSLPHGKRVPMLGALLWTGMGKAMDQRPMASSYLGWILLKRLGFLPAAYSLSFATLISADASRQSANHEPRT
jgi:hypothetical protein